MKIEEVNIQQFGCLRDFHIPFRDGVNIIYGENGVGKTTLFTFIKAAFYGMPSGRGAKERAHYLPWDGGKMQGSLVFSEAGNRRLLQMTFGKTPRSDKIVLLDDVTGREIADIDPNKLGCTLFGMGENTFTKTALVRQNGPAMDAKTDDEIAAKLTNLQQSGDESVSYSAAKSFLVTAQRSLVAARGDGGRLDRLEQEIVTVKEQLAQAQKQNELNLQSQQSLNELYRKRDALGLRAEELAVMQERADYIRCKNLLGQIETIQQQLKSLRGRKEVDAAKLREDILRLHEYKDMQKRQKAQLDLSKEKRDTLAATIRESNISDAAFAEVTRLYHAPKKAGSLTVAVISWIAAALCVLPGLLLSPYFWIGTVVLTIVGFVCLPKGRKETTELKEKLDAFHAADYETFVSCYQESAKRTVQLAEFEAQIIQLEKEQRELEISVAAFEERCQKQYGSYEDGILEQILDETAKEDRERETLAAKLALLRDSYESIRGQREYDEWIARFGEQPENLPERLEETEEIKRELLHITEEIARREEELRHCMPPAKWQEQLDCLCEEQQRLRGIYESLGTAEEVLEEAYSVLEGEFGPRLNERAAEYLAEISAGRYGEARIAKDYAIKLTEKGEVRELDCFSAGTFDQAYLAFRLAMLSLMECGAPVFLDDSLMQFDDKRAEETMRFLVRFAQEEEIQIFLFTCRWRDYQLCGGLDSINRIKIE